MNVKLEKDHTLTNALWRKPARTMTVVTDVDALTLEMGLNKYQKPNVKVTNVVRPITKLLLN